MTTISTTPSGTIPNQRFTQTSRFVATFAAGVALATGVAVGIHVAQDNGTAARGTETPSVQVTPVAVADPGCRVRVPGPC